MQVILKKRLDLKPYRIRVVQQLKEDDPLKRLYFCDFLVNELNTNPEYLHMLMFSDEARFCLNGTVVPANYRFVFYEFLCDNC